VQDPEGPYLCLPRIVDIRSDITTKALDEKGWAVTIDEQQENFKVQDLERKIFTPDRNRAMCAAFLQHAQKDPAGQIGKSIILVESDARHSADENLNEMQPQCRDHHPRIPEASAIAKTSATASGGTGACRSYAVHRLQPRPAQRGLMPIFSPTSTSIGAVAHMLYVQTQRLGVEKKRLPADFCVAVHEISTATACH
jgi:hypothetical protein